MDLGIISMRYAKALMLFATEKHEEEKVYQETTTMAESFLAIPQLQMAMTNPVIPDKQKIQLLLIAACGQNAPTQSLKRFVDLVIKKMRADIMLFIAHSYGTIYREAKHIIHGKLVVPTQLDAKLISKLQNMVESKSQCTVDFKVQEKPEIEGGFILEYGTYRLDASVRTQLAKLKRELH
ncbi:MAG: F0F1 ATP synthase subunit delta [Prevotellamassilia sp.]|nr:F0F1 ATP synthase subunit delta [Prevotellamassilia sp.]